MLKAITATKAAINCDFFTFLAPKMFAYLVILAVAINNQCIGTSVPEWSIVEEKGF